MLEKILGGDVDARIVAAARMIIGAAMVAGLAALQRLLTDPGVSSYSWVPIALLVLRVVEGFFDHASTSRPG